MTRCIFSSELELELELLEPLEDPLEELELLPLEELLEELCLRDFCDFLGAVFFLGVGFFFDFFSFDELVSEPEELLELELDFPAFFPAALDFFSFEVEEPLESEPALFPFLPDLPGLS